ncbi:MAG: hypothetical protein ACK5OC_25135 [Pirellula sp.]|jgi:hypothetical protein
MKIPRGMFFLGTVEIASGADGNARSLLAELGEISHHLNKGGLEFTRIAGNLEQTP